MLFVTMFRLPATLANFLSATHEPLSIEDRRHLADLFLRQVMQTSTAQFAIASVVYWLISREAIGHVAWLLGMYAFCMLRILICWRDRRRVPALSESGMLSLSRRQVVLSTLNGLGWGLIPWVAYNSPHALLDFITGAIVFGICGSATTTLAGLRHAGSGFLLAAILPFTFNGWLNGPRLYTSIAWVTLFGMLALMYFGRTVRRAWVQSITLQRRNAELALQLQAEKLAVEESMRVKSLFLDGVSHDLRHPLHALGLFLRFLRENPRGLDQALPGMEQALGGMSTLLERLLLLSRLEAGEMHVLREPVDVAAMIRNVQVQSVAVAAAKGLRVHARLAPCVLHTDAAMLESITANLLSNALRYTARGGVLVSLRWRTEGHWALRVYDTGVGIESSQLPLLFEAYRRFDDRRRAGDQGWGLGLALVKLQCTALGYAIDVRSRPGRGSVFTLRMPVTG